MRLIVAGALVAGALGAICRLTSVEWAILVLAVAQVALAEAVNAALERWIDLVKPEWHSLARDAKDLAAGAVLLTVLASILLGFLLFARHLTPS
jgi:diacylglycerol kinase